jgi:hypothetical protein
MPASERSAPPKHLQAQRKPSKPQIKFLRMCPIFQTQRSVQDVRWATVVQKRNKQTGEVTETPVGIKFTALLMFFLLVLIAFLFW